MVVHIGVILIMCCFVWCLLGGATAGGVISLLWFGRRLPKWGCKFLEMTLMLTADHGPAVSGAHNTIVTARAGKDLISALCSGLLTIGPRFGGAIDGAATQFSEYHMPMRMSIHMSIHVSIHVAMHVAIHVAIHISTHMSIHMSYARCGYTVQRCIRPWALA